MKNPHKFLNYEINLWRIQVEPDAWEMATAVVFIFSGIKL